MKKIHTTQCRIDAIKGGFMMFFVTIMVHVMMISIPATIDLEPFPNKHIADKVTSKYVSYPGKKSLY